MIKTTDTTPISATRLMDVAREITLQLGEWQYHPNLTVTCHNDLGGRPHVAINLVGSGIPNADQSAFLDDLAMVLDVVPHVTPDWIGTVRRPDYRGTAVTVSGLGRVGGVR